MPILKSQYKSPPLYRNGHIQTLLPFLLRGDLCPGGIKKVHTTSDGDRVSSRLYLSPGSSSLTIITHGLEGNYEDPYIVSLANLLTTHGHNCLTWSHRSCDGEVNLTSKFYNACESEDLEFIINNYSQDYNEINLIGISLGGSITANYLGRKHDKISPKLKKACLISTPLDLPSSRDSLESKLNRFLYHRIFVTSIKGKILEKSKILDLPIDLQAIKKARFISDFDDCLMGPLYGYRDGAHYREEASSLPYLQNISIPLYILNAQDDPFLGKFSFPRQLAQAHDNIFLETPLHGGHVGFIQSIKKKSFFHEQRILEFLK